MVTVTAGMLGWTPGARRLQTPNVSQSDETHSTAAQLSGMYFLGLLEWPSHFLP